MEFFQFLGINININESSSPLLLLVCGIFGLCFIALLCFINILTYFFIMYILDHSLIKNKITNIYLIKLINLYKKTRLSFLIFEVILFISCILSVLYFCLRIILAYINI
jgi:hypothetical protein